MIMSLGAPRRRKRIEDVLCPDLRVRLTTFCTTASWTFSSAVVGALLDCLRHDDCVLVTAHVVQVDERHGHVRNLSLGPAGRRRPQIIDPPRSTNAVASAAL